MNFACPFSDTDWMTTLPLLVEEAEDVDRHIQLMLECRIVLVGDWLGDVVQANLLKNVGVMATSIGVLFIWQG